MYRSNTRGSVREVYRDGRAAKFEWTIPDCAHLRQDFSNSPAVYYFDRSWCLAINKNRSVVHCVYLGSEFSTPGIRESVRFTVVYKAPDGGEQDVARDRTLPEGSTGDSIPFSPHITPSPAGFTLACTLWKGGVSRETQTEDADGQNDEPHSKAISSLLEHYKKLLLSGTGHDVLFKVGDQQFRAHKHVLEARSPVFAAMFGHEMAESAQGSVTIEDCDPEAFGEFLQFVYSGKADVASVGSALGLYYAGDKYDFPSLKEMCVEFLKNSLARTTVFDVIHLAARHGEEELMQRAIVFFADNLEEVMLTVEWQRFLAANPVQANEMSVKAVQCLKTSLCKK